MFKDRSTFDIVVILLTATVGLTMVLVVAGVIMLRLFRPEVDVKGAGTVIGNVLTTLVGALVGFVGGRATGRMEEKAANGTKT
jgi:hypothetical protein